MGVSVGCVAVLAALLADPAGALSAADPPAEIRIHRTTGPIKIDGDLSDEGWRGATKIERFYETNPRDNVEPAVKTVGYLTYDDTYLYAAVEFFEPEPKSIRAPLGERDQVPSYTDYGGLILDTKHDGKTGVLLIANPRNVQYDSVSNDATGIEDASYDIFWDSATKILSDRWVLELRVPFSSLRYNPSNIQTWGVLLYRNRPRNFRVQMFSAPLPRGSNCFICHCNTLTGLEGLPKGGHVVVAPYGTAQDQQLPVGNSLGAPLAPAKAKGEVGIDAKWLPNADNAIDATINPDFSQVESDVAQIATNQQFALFYPEKRPFFLEGLELLTTPIQAVYTRTVTAPSWGGRATGEFGATSYTLLLTEDRGGGSVIEPGNQSSTLVAQDYASRVLIGRARYDLSSSAYGSFLLTDRENLGGGYNRVGGPDFLWRPSTADVVTGQLLLSQTQNPNRPDLYSTWLGQTFDSHAADFAWNRSTRTWDAYAEFRDIGDGFRADEGYVPQVGYRDLRDAVGYSWYPSDSPFWNHVRPFLSTREATDETGNPLFRRVNPGFSFNGFWSSYTELDLNLDRLRVGNDLFNRTQFLWTTNLSPSRFVSLIQFSGFLGQEMDFDNIRPGHGGSFNGEITLRPADALLVDFIGSFAWLNVDADGRRNARLFDADVLRLKVEYFFSARAFLRLIAQDSRSIQDPSLYIAATQPLVDSRSGSALLGYRIDWQTILFIGVGDDRETDLTGRLSPQDRTLFAKISYAFQH
jgi:hypothetical protein